MIIQGFNVKTLAESLLCAMHDVDLKVAEADVPQHCKTSETMRLSLNKKRGRDLPSTMTFDPMRYVHILTSVCAFV